MNYQETFKQALAKLDALQADYAAKEQQLVATGNEISGVADVLNALSPLAGQKPSFNEVVTEILQTVKQASVMEAGITETIRQFLQANVGKAFYPITVRSGLEGLKYDLSKHVNAMATIHSVLKRLVEQQQVLAAPQPDGKTAYQWNVAKK